MVLRDLVAELVSASGRGKLICKSRILAKNGREYEYCISNLDDVCNIIYVNADTLKYFLHRRPKDIINLKLTADNRIIVDRHNKHYGTKNVITSKTCSFLYVKDLIAGNILNQNIFTNTKYQKYGEVPWHINWNHMIVGTGYILNDAKIAEIKKYYSDECAVKIMDAYEVRASIVHDTDFRERLAVFYAKQMHEARYIHIDNIKSERALKAYGIIKNGFMKSNFLVRDPNLLFILFILYGHHMYTFEHSINVAIYSCMLYSILYNREFSKEEHRENLIDLFICGLLHDIGKISIPVSIIDKPGKLDDDEFKIMRNHPTVSYRIIKQLCNCKSSIFVEYRNNTNRALRIINGAYYHHRDTTMIEGKTTFGYPEKLDVLLDNEPDGWFYKIIKTADVLDGMTSQRPYRARKGKVPAQNQREYLGIVKIVNTLMYESLLRGEISEKEYKAVKEMMYVDDNHDIDDEYGAKITNINFNKAIISNYMDITNFENYKE